MAKRRMGPWELAVVVGLGAVAAVMGYLWYELSGMQAALAELTPAPKAAPASANLPTSVRSDVPLAAIEAQGAAILKLDARLGAVERQLSLVMTFVQAQEDKAGRVRASAEDLADMVAALREDIDMLLGREWERFDQEAQVAVPGAEGAHVAEPAEEPALGEEDTTAEAAAAEVEPTAAEEQPSVWEPLIREAEVAWRRDFSEMAGLDGDQRAQLDAVLDELDGSASDTIAQALQGQLSADDAGNRLRRAHRRAYQDLQKVLSSQQREKLRAELQRRNDLRWSLWLSGQ